MRIDRFHLVTFMARIWLVGCQVMMIAENAATSSWSSLNIIKHHDHHQTSWSSFNIIKHHRTRSVSPVSSSLPPNDQGAQVLLAQLLEAAQEESRVGATQQLGHGLPGVDWTNVDAWQMPTDVENISKIGNIGKYGRDMNVVTLIAF